MMTEVSTVGKRTPRRSWLKFRVRTVMLLIAVLGAWLATHVNRVRHEQAAVVAVRGLGGHVRYDWEPDLTAVSDRMKQVRSAMQAGRSTPVFTTEPSGPLWLRQLIGDEYFQYITEVDLRGDRWERTPLEISGEDFQLITSLKRLERLVLVNTDANDDSLRHVRKATHLRALVIRDSPITNAGLVHLHALHDLEQLQLINTAVTAEGVVKLQERLPNCVVRVN